jgi:hypothetical protein
MPYRTPIYCNSSWEPSTAASSAGCFCCMGWPNNYSIFPGISYSRHLRPHVSAKTPELYVIPSSSVLYFKKRPEFQKTVLYHKKRKSTALVEIAPAITETC